VAPPRVAVHAAIPAPSVPAATPVLPGPVLAAAATATAHPVLHHLARTSHAAPRTVVRTAAPGPDHTRSTSRALAPAHASASATPPRSPAPAAMPLRLVPSEQPAPNSPVPSSGAPLGTSGQTSIAPLALLPVGLTGWLVALAPPHRGRPLQLPGTPSRSSPAPLALERPG
jgi:hypothetical protein